jgi:hypothetical protein
MPAAPAGPLRPGAFDLGADAMRPWLPPILWFLLTIPAAQAAANLQAFPPAEAGQVRYVLDVPPQEAERSTPPVSQPMALRIPISRLSSGDSPDALSQAKMVRCQQAARRRYEDDPLPPGEGGMEVGLARAAWRLRQAVLATVPWQSSRPSPAGMGACSGAGPCSRSVRHRGRGSWVNASGHGPQG